MTIRTAMHGSDLDSLLLAGADLLLTGAGGGFCD
jgi:hypothetical protein